jgi:hypothetical protein
MVARYRLEDGIETLRSHWSYDQAAGRSEPSRAKELDRRSSHGQSGLAKGEDPDPACGIWLQALQMGSQCGAWRSGRSGRAVQVVQQGLGGLVGRAHAMAL